MIINFQDYVKKIKEIKSKAKTDLKYYNFMSVLYSGICYKEGDSDGLTEDEFLALCYCKRTCNYVDLDTIQGCLIGGAIGDALGFPVEFFEDYIIFENFGENGITELQTSDGVALVSDDTQMTLFTADGLISATKKFSKPTADNYLQSIYESYLNWLCTQDSFFSLDENVRKSELLKIKELYSQRAPGHTCLNALRSGEYGTLDCKINDSKGCGGIMRVAPISLYLSQIKEFEEEDIALLTARTVALTHGHALGYIPSAYLSCLLHYILKGNTISIAIAKTDGVIRKVFPNLEETEICLSLVEKAEKLAFLGKDDETDELDDLEAIRMLGEGWVAEETLAIAIYCSLKYCDDFEKAIIASVNHSGDSDSTGAVTGNIMGAYLGLKNIPKKMVDVIELKDLMLYLAEKMQLNKLDK